MMNMTNTSRHDRGAPASQGGKFKATDGTEGSVELETVRSLSEKPLTFRTYPDVEPQSFKPHEIGSDLPAVFVDVSPTTVTGGIFVGVEPGTDTEAFMAAEYGARYDAPDFEDEQVQIMFTVDAPLKPYSRRDAVEALDNTKLRQLASDNADGTLERKLTAWRSRPAV